jgi:hypothetical protein
MIFKVQSCKEREYFCQRYFYDCIFDLKIFNIADQILLGYNGGNWTYKLSDNTPFFMLESITEKQTLRNPHSGEEFEMNENLAGMIITFYALALVVEKTRNEKLIFDYENLKDVIYNYAEEIGEVKQAFGMIN